MNIAAYIAANARYRAGKVGDVEVKTKLSTAVNAMLDPIRERRAAVLARVAAWNAAGIRVLSFRHEQNAGYAAAIAKSISEAPAATQAEITTSIGATLKKSFGSAADLASKYPDYSQAIMDAAKQSFLDGANWAYASGIFVMLIGMIITFFFFPKKNRERELYAEYAKQSSTVH